MKHMKKFLAILLAAVMLLSGCGSKLSNYATTVAATYGDRTIYMDEANFWLRLTQLNYSYYVQIYAYYYGVDFWSSASGRRTQTYWESVREDVMAQFLQLNILLDHTGDYSDTALTDEDYKKIDTAIADLKSEYSTLFDETVIGSYSDEQIRNSFIRRAQAAKVWHAVREETVTDVKEEDCKSFTLKYFNVTDTSTGTGEDGLILTGEQLANFLYSELQRGTAFEDLVEAFTGLDSQTVSYRRNDTEKEGLIMNRLGRDLKDGESAMEESGGIWYVVYCESADDEKAAADARKSLESEQKEAHFEEVYAEWKKAAKPFDVKSVYTRLTTSAE